MQTSEIVLTEQVEVCYRAADDDGDYLHTETLIVPGKLPAEAKARTDWDAARQAEMAAQHATWYALMIAPTPALTKADLERELARKRQDKAAAERDIATLIAAVAVAAEAEPLEERPVEGVKVG
jgi:hypothetical protein